jgi:hypothetical protein
MLVSQIALVSRSAKVSNHDVQEVAAALQIQVARDWSPLWHSRALVAPFGRLEDVPAGYWPVLIVDEAAPFARVRLHNDGQPFEVVEAGGSWSLSASQACLAMLGDPSGNRLVVAESVVLRHGTVEFLLDVCGPVADPRYAYLIDGIIVSDFYTPAYFHLEASRARYSFSGALERARQILPGGHLTWREPASKSWHQLTFFGSQPSMRDLGRRPPEELRSRAWVNAITPELRRLAHLGGDVPIVAAGLAARQSTRRKSLELAQGLFAGIEVIEFQAE